MAHPRLRRPEGERCQNPPALPADSTTDADAFSRTDMREQAKLTPSGNIRAE